eukprot:scaffold649703_cov51-Prasinocladus_malaysianus.AAC.1
MVPRSSSRSGDSPPGLGAVEARHNARGLAAGWIRAEHGPGEVGHAHIGGGRLPVAGPWGAGCRGVLPSRGQVGQATHFSAPCKLYARVAT